MTPETDAPELFDLFPIPLQRVPRVLDPRLITTLVDRFATRAQRANSRSSHLQHTEPVSPDGDAALKQVCERVAPHVHKFGDLLLGEPRQWMIKELWINVLEHGGSQTLHNHANSFVSGVLYLTDSHSSASTTFMKAAGGGDFVFNNENARVELGPYNAGKWVAPDARAGDMVLFPSYLLHEVPANQGARRISLAFNAIPDRLDSWGYTLTLGR